MTHKDTHAYHQGTLPNKREFARTSSVFTAQLQPDNGPPLTGFVDSFSIKGLHVRSAQRVPVGTRCQITLTPDSLPERSPLRFRARPVQIAARGKITRLTDVGLGVEFTDILGQESFDYLCYFLRTLAEDTERIEREIRASTWAYLTPDTSDSSDSVVAPRPDTLIRRRPGRHLAFSKSG